MARDGGLPGRTNTIMQTCFFAISGVLPRDDAIARIKDAIEKTYGRKGAEVVERNFAAVDNALGPCSGSRCRARITRRPRRRSRSCPPTRRTSCAQVTGMMLAGRGDELPVSALPVDGTYPSGTAAWEKRNISDLVPVWEPETCASSAATAAWSARTA